MPGDGAGPSPERAFALLGNETRIGILRALWEAGDPLSFSALRERVGVDDSGQFNYHLDGLRGTFVRRTDEGYALRVPGIRVAGAVLSGSYTTGHHVDPVPVEGSCPDCGGDFALDTDEEAENVRVRCVDCGRVVSQASVPPTVVADHDREELPAAYDRWVRSQFARSLDGFCVNCEGRVEPVLVPDRDGGRGPGVDCSCERCGATVSTSAATVLLFHPAVVSLYHDHGVDLDAVPLWNLGWSRGNTTRVVSEDPLRVAVTVEVDGDARTLTLDRAADVVAVADE